MDRRVNVSHLKIGMYVSELDRPWIDTPFLLEGFLIETEEDLTTLIHYCEFVYINPARGIEATVYFEEKPLLKSNPYLERFLQDNKKSVDYENTVEAKEELPAAKVALENASNQVAHMLASVKDGKSLDIKEVRGVVEPILDRAVKHI